MLGVHVKGQAGGAPNSAVATAKIRQETIVSIIYVEDYST